MSGFIFVPSELVEDVSNLTFSPMVDRRMQTLMRRNNDGELSADELDELESLVEMSERLSLVRAGAMRLLRRSPT